MREIKRGEEWREEMRRRDVNKSGEEERRDEKKRGVEWRVERKRENRDEGSSGCMRCKGRYK